MSFGFSVGDFISIGTLALKLYVAYREGPLEFREISRELLSLHTTLEEISSNLSAPVSLFSRSPGTKLNLERLVEGCAEALKELEGIWNKYQALDGRAKKFSWQRMKFGKENLDGVRAKLGVHLQGLMVFLTTVGCDSLSRVEGKLETLVRIEERLDGLFAQIEEMQRAPARDGSYRDAVVSPVSMASMEDEVESVVSALQSDGVSKREVFENIDFVSAVVQWRNRVTPSLGEETSGDEWVRQRRVEGRVSPEPGPPDNRQAAPKPIGYERQKASHNGVEIIRPYPSSETSASSPRRTISLRNLRSPSPEGIHFDYEAEDPYSSSKQVVYATPNYTYNTLPRRGRRDEQSPQRPPTYHTEKPLRIPTPSQYRYHRPPDPSYQPADKQSSRPSTENRTWAEESKQPRRHRSKLEVFSPILHQDPQLINTSRRYAAPTHEPSQPRWTQAESTYNNRVPTWPYPSDQQMKVENLGDTTSPPARNTVVNQHPPLYSPETGRIKRDRQEMTRIVQDSIRNTAERQPNPGTYYGEPYRRQTQVEPVVSRQREWWEEG